MQAVSDPPGQPEGVGTGEGDGGTGTGVGTGGTGVGAGDGFGCQHGLQSPCSPSSSLRQAWPNVGSTAQHGAQGPVFRVSHVPSQVAHWSKQAPVGSLQPPGIIGTGDGEGAGVGTGEGVGGVGVGCQHCRQSFPLSLRQDVPNVGSVAQHCAHMLVLRDSHVPSQGAQTPVQASVGSLHPPGEGAGGGVGGVGGVGAGGTYLSLHQCWKSAWPPSDGFHPPHRGTTSFAW